MKKNNGYLIFTEVILVTFVIAAAAVFLYIREKDAARQEVADQIAARDRSASENVPQSNGASSNGNHSAMLELDTNTEEPNVFPATQPTLNTSTTGNQPVQTVVRTAAVRSEDPKTVKSSDLPDIPRLPSLITSPSRQLTETSWQNPWNESHWKSSGWEFSVEGMASDASLFAWTTFQRTYRLLSLEVSLNHESEAGFLEILLTAPKTGSMMSVLIENERVVVSEKFNGERHIIETKAHTFSLPDGQPAVLKLAATGSRVLLFWNGRRVLTCEQPIHQSGCSLLCTIVTRGCPTMISALRIEGE